MTKNNEEATPRFVKRSPAASGAEYLGLVKQLIDRYRSSQIKAAVKVNTALLEFYWSLGRDIVRMQADSKWGSGFFDSLSLDLKAASPGITGFSATNLKYAKRWYMFYTQPDIIRHQLGDELEMPVDFGKVPWRHHIEILTHSKTVAEALFYIDETIRNGWSRRQLEIAIEHRLYSSPKNVVTNFDTVLPAPQSGLAKSILKSPYNFSLLEAGADRTEKILEDALAQNITRFLLELGQGFRTAAVGEYDTEDGRGYRFV